MSSQQTTPAAYEDVVDALNDVVEARVAEERAYDARREAEERLAQIVSVTRRDKDMGFDAEQAARELIVARALGRNRLYADGGAE